MTVERQRGEVGGLPEQDWSLRVTQAYRRDGSEWQRVHRHADPLVRAISLEQAAALARGAKQADDIGRMLAPRAGFEPATIRLTVECSTAELPRNDAKPKGFASGSV